MSSPRRILLLSRYSALGASSRVRMYQYLPALRASGFEVTCAPLFSDVYLQQRYAGSGISWREVARGVLRRFRWMRRIRQFDLVWIEYEMLPWLPLVAEVWAGSGVPHIVEYDDAVFHRYDRHASRLVRRLLGRKIDHVMRRASVVIAGNDYLADRARRAGASRIVTIPSVVDLTRYVVPPPRTNDVPVIGWIGSPTTAAYLHSIGPALRHVSEQLGARIVLVGVEPGRTRWAFPCEERPWQDSREVDDINEFDVGIMPLPDELWARGKCGYKLVQYLACGKPVVASPVGANLQIVEPGRTGLFASTTEEWIAALTRFGADPNLRTQMGQAGRARVEAHFALQATTAALVGVMEDALACDRS